MYEVLNEKETRLISSNSREIVGGSLVEHIPGRMGQELDGARSAEKLAVLRLIITSKDSTLW